MPSKTFYKLSDQKRRRILEEAYKEFSLNTYEAASITNLVKSLGIAKGSIYQYFNDKADLYTYLVQEATSKLNKLLDSTCSYNNEEFYDWYLKLLIVEVKFLISFPAYAVLLVEMSHGVHELDRQLKTSFFSQKKSRINHALPVELYNSAINNHLLIHSPFLVYEMISSKTDIVNTIKSNESVSIDPKALITACTDWVAKLKHGL